MGKKVSPGPITNDDGIPYDYIVIVDSGSKGLRVYVYNWLNPQMVLEKDYALRKPQLHSVHEVRRSEEKIPGEGVVESDSEDDSGSDSETETGDLLFPKVYTGKHWHRKITPGISSFNLLPQKIGKHHMKHLVKLAMGVVPELQHTRTPVFVHLTAGMRLLPPTEQQEILDQICSYLQRKSPFYIPECLSHVNVLNGDVEGIYGWLLVNALTGALDHPEDHDHGKNHTTYGLLDMGGALTQVVFQPNLTEIAEHQNNLYRIELRKVPVGGKWRGKKGEKGPKEKTPPALEPREASEASAPRLAESKKKQPEKPSKSVSSWETSPASPFQEPSEASFSVYSDSFLGFGMYQAHNRYLSSLITAFAAEHNIELIGKPRIRMPVPDPCLPKGYTTLVQVDDISVSFVGESDFSRCLQNIFPVLVNGTFSAGTPELKSTNCKLHLAEDEMGSCLFNDLIPLFDFDVNHFIGVSGYWDAINNLLGPGALALTKYDYQLIYNKTRTVCGEPFSLLIELNSVKSGSAHMPEDDLAELCFKSSWILNFLHLGLGFPRFGIDESKNDTYGALRLVEDFDGQSFSWTLGRAILYANDEYVQAFNNYLSEGVKRPGFYHSALESVFHYGAEQHGVLPRPQFDVRTMSKTSLGGYVDSPSSELTWYIHPHRWYGISIFAVLIMFIGLLMLGREGRKRILYKIKLWFRRGPTYEEVPEYEMNDVGELFKVDEEE